MSQPTDNKPQLLIDLTNARQATALNADSILHRVQLEAFLNRVEDVVERVSGFRNKLGEYGHKRSVSYERYHDVITLHGKRGSGKTTFLLSALKLLQESDVRKENFKDNVWKHLDRLCVLEILDPTLFGLHEHLLLSLLAKIAFEVRSAFKSRQISSCDFHKAECNLESWEKKLQKFAKSLKHMGETRDDLEGSTPKETVPWEDAEFIFEKNMDNAQSSFGLERGFHNFLNESLNLLGKDAFVLALDDIDTRPQIGWHVLEVLRRYFTSPQLVVVLSGDMDLFKAIIEKQQLKIFDLNFDSNAGVRKEFKSRVDGLTEQYLLKILRTPSRINLGSFQSAVEKSNGRVYVGVPEKDSLQIDKILELSFYPILACHRYVEQRHFREALFANSARTVTQVLDVLWRGARKSEGNAKDEHADALTDDSIVSRMREVFFVSLQNLGFDRPFDFADIFKTQQGINLLMKNLFERGYVASGLDLLPTRKNIDENNALLALSAELAQVVRDKPAMLFSYALKACLVREVLLRQPSEIGANNYERCERYLGLEAEEPLSILGARIAALHAGEPNSSGAIRAMGLVSLYAKSITSNGPKAIKAMYNSDRGLLENAGIEFIPLPLRQFCVVSKDVTANTSVVGRWFNTHESLVRNIKSWQAYLLGLGVIDLRVRDGFFRVVSIFPLLAAMCDFLECGDDDVAIILQQYSQLFRVNCFKWSDSSVLSKSNVNTEEDEEENSDLPLSEELPAIDKKFISAMNAWRKSSLEGLVGVTSPAQLCSRVISRFFGALAKIEGSDSKDLKFVGVYIHRCIISFMNSVLVEECLMNSKDNRGVGVLMNNPTSKDDIFISNIVKTKVISGCDSRLKNQNEVQLQMLRKKSPRRVDGGDEKSDFCRIDKNYPLFNAVFTCPLWGLYLDPSKGVSEKSIYDIYFDVIKDFGIDIGVFSVCYMEQRSTFDNLYYALNSLAIQ